MAHTLLQQVWSITSTANRPTVFIQNVLGLTGTQEGLQHYYIYLLNNNGKIGLYGRDSSTTANGAIMLCIKDKIGNNHSAVIVNLSVDINGNILYHISTNETVKFFKYVLDDETKTESFTYILAQDINDEWVIFSGDKMYSDYGETGIYNNFYNGAHSEIVDGGNMFMISEAYRFDTGVKFKELYFVLSAKSYSDTNCIIEYKGKKYRLVSVSNVKDETGRYPAFAFPVSD